MSYFKITLHRSAIGLPRRTHGVLMALGLRRRNQTVFHPVKPDFAGMIMKVKEIVRVEAVDRALTKAEMKALRTPPTGYWVETAAAAHGDAPKVAEAGAHGETSKVVEGGADAQNEGRPRAWRRGQAFVEEKVDYAAIL